MVTTYIGSDIFKFMVMFTAVYMSLNTVGVLQYHYYAKAITLNDLQIPA